MDYDLVDLIDIHELKELSKKCSKLINLPIRIFDQHDNILLEYDWLPVCTDFHRINPITSERCHQAELETFQQLKSGKEFWYIRCPNGLMNTGAAIIVEGKYLGGLGFGPFFLEPPDMEFFSQQADEFGFDKEKYLQAVADVPVLTIEHVEQVSKIWCGLAGMIAKTGLEGLRLQELRKSEEKLQMTQFVMDHALNRITWIAPDGRFLYANTAACREMEYTLEELLTLTVSDIDLHFPTGKWSEQFQDIKKMGSRRFETQQLDGKGHIHEVDVSTQYFKFGDREFICSFSRDITEQKRVEKNLTEQLTFEQLITDIASQLAETDSEKLENSIDSTLKNLALFLQQERSFLARFSENNNSLIITNKWGMEGVTFPSDVFTKDIAAAVPWVARTIQGGGVIKANPGLTGLPDEAKKLHYHLSSQGVTSGLVVPMSAAGKTIGMLGLDTINHPRTYSKATVKRLRLVADLMGAAISRIQAQKSLTKSLATIKQLNDHVEQENLYLRKEVLLKHTHEGILGESSAIHKVKAAIEQVAVSNATVLITGETGTGKELVSHAIHQYSQRKNSSMINLNCAALPATLLEAELFGREKGAYTGALTRQAGRFELANGGTLFLDEIGELPLELQSKLLRVLESGEFERLGGYQARKTDARIIAATNKDLAREVARGRFREDLFYRLNVFPIHVPPLRERTMDIPMLVWHFNQVLSRGMGKSISNISPKDMEKLKEYRWPGNVRELKNVIERALIVCRHGKLHIELGTATAALSDDALTLDEVNQKHIIRILERTGWKIRGKYGAAKLLAINPQTLDSRMKKLGIKRPAQNPAIS